MKYGDTVSHLLGVKDPTPITETNASLLRASYELGVRKTDYQSSERNLEVARRNLLERVAQEKSILAVPELLAELANAWGMAWADIATIAGVSVSAVRKWRTGGAATPDNRRRLARVAAFLNVLSEHYAVGDPAQWLEMELALPPGYAIRPIDLYLEGHELALLDIAGQKSVTVVLDEIKPEWRENRSRFEVVDGADGYRFIRVRDGDVLT